MLSALQAGNKGTQACITAATAVSGIIADLDTTIMFATAGTLNAENGETFADHRYWQRFQLECLQPVIAYGHPARTQKCGLPILIATSYSVRNVNHRFRISSLSKLETASPIRGELFDVCIPGSCPSDCPETQQDQERHI